MHLKINNVDELRDSLQAIGYGEYFISTKEGLERVGFEIDYIPKTDKFLVQSLIGNEVRRLTVTAINEDFIGYAMVAGNFYKSND